MESGRSAVRPLRRDVVPPPEESARRRRLRLAAVLALVSTPLLVALLDLHAPRWYPIGDWALTELRVRDVALAHPPLTGLSGRLFAYGERGQHPGPLSFYALAPVYRLLGSSSFSLLAATAVLNAVALGLSLWIADRRAGVRGLLVTAVGLALLVHAYGTTQLLAPWNPWLPMLWWVVFLLAAWSVLCDDTALLPVATVSGWFCVQTHVSYLGSVPVLLLLVAIVVAVRWRRDPRPDQRRVTVRWAWVSLGISAVVWLPVVIDELVNEPGNLSIIARYFSDPGEPVVGPGAALEVLLGHLSPVGLLAGEQRMTGSTGIGILVLIVWLLAALVAVRVRHERLVALHAVVAAALVVGLVSTSRIVGNPWPYLVLWLWGTVTVLLAAVLSTTAVVVARRWPGPGRLRAQVLVLPAVVALLTVATIADDDRAALPYDGMSATFRHLAPQVVTAIRTGAVPGGGADGRYTVSWDPDVVPAYLSPQGLLLELDRAGIDASMLPERRVANPVDRHRTAPLEETDAVLTYVTGDDAIQRWRARSDAVEVAHAPAPPADVAELAASRAYVTQLLSTLGLADLAAMVDVDLISVSGDERLPAVLRDRVQRMLDLSVPTSVFAQAVG